MHIEVQHTGRGKVWDAEELADRLGSIFSGHRDLPRQFGEPLPTKELAWISMVVTTA